MAGQHLPALTFEVLRQTVRPLVVRGLIAAGMSCPQILRVSTVTMRSPMSFSTLPDLMEFVGEDVDAVRG